CLLFPNLKVMSREITEERIARQAPEAPATSHGLLATMMLSRTPPRPAAAAFVPARHGTPVPTPWNGSLARRRGSRRAHSPSAPAALLRAVAGRDREGRARGLRCAHGRLR